MSTEVMTPIVDFTPESALRHAEEIVQSFARRMLADEKCPLSEHEMHTIALASRHAVAVAIIEARHDPRALPHVLFCVASFLRFVSEGIIPVAHAEGKQ